MDDLNADALPPSMQDQLQSAPSPQYSDPSQATNYPAQASSPYNYQQPYGYPLPTDQQYYYPYQQRQYPQGPPYPAQAQANGVGTAAGIVGIVGACVSLIPFIGILLGIAMGALAVMLGAVGLGNPSHQGRGMATAGVTLGLLTIVFKLIPGINIL